jgi:hypothetical protein
MKRSSRPPGNSLRWFSGQVLGAYSTPQDRDARIIGVRSNHGVKLTRVGV